MSASTAVKAIKKTKKAPKIVKKRTKTFFRFQSDRFMRVKVCLALLLLFYYYRLLGENPAVSITGSEESSRARSSCPRLDMVPERRPDTSFRTACIHL